MEITESKLRLICSTLFHGPFILSFKVIKSWIIRRLLGTCISLTIIIKETVPVFMSKRISCYPSEQETWGIGFCRLWTNQSCSFESCTVHYEADDTQTNSQWSSLIANSTSLHWEDKKSFSKLAVTFLISNPVNTLKSLHKRASFYQVGKQRLWGRLISL